MKSLRTFLLLAGLSILPYFLQAQSNDDAVENELNTWIEFKLQKKITKKWSVDFVPEIRLREQMKTQKLLLEASTSYELLKWLEISAGYRYGYISEDEESENRRLLELKTEFEVFRFEPSIRVKYTNDKDADDDIENTIRFMGAVAYNIRKNPFTPSISMEWFQSITEGEATKVRYSAGFDYKLNKHHYLSAEYKLDYYLTKYKNRHIVGLGYKYKF